MRNAVTIPIDGDKLRACLAIQNYSLQGASRAMGFGSSYFNQVISRGNITPYGAKLVESVLGISLDMYKVAEVKVEVEDVPDEQPSPNSEIVSELREIKELLRQILEVWS